MAFVGEIGREPAIRHEARDDLLTRLIEAEEDGERLSHDELIVLFTNIFGGAVETTTSVMSGTFLELARHPDQLELLRADPERAQAGHGGRDPALSTGHLHERATRRPPPTELAGLHFEEVEPVSTIIGGPNRECVALSKIRTASTSPATQTLWSFTFSMGPHFCLGQALARAKLQETTATIARHTRDLELTARAAVVCRK